MKIDESESIIKNVNVNESSFDSIKDTIKEIDEKINVLISNDSENEEYSALNKDIIVLNEQITESQSIYENHLKYKNQIAELDTGVSELSTIGITDSRIISLESKTEKTE